MLWNLQFPFQLKLDFNGDLSCESISLFRIEMKQSNAEQKKYNPRNDWDYWGFNRFIAHQRINGLTLKMENAVGGVDVWLCACDLKNAPNKWNEWFSVYSHEHGINRFRSLNSVRTFARFSMAKNNRLSIFMLTVSPCGFWFWAGIFSWKIINRNVSNLFRFI